MTIKPVGSHKRTAGGAADAENKETLSNVGMAVGETPASALVQQGRNASALAQRNTSDTHSKNPATHGADIVFDELSRSRLCPHKTIRSKRREMQNNENFKRERKYNAEGNKNSCESKAANTCSIASNKVCSSTSTLTMPGGVGVGINQTAPNANAPSANIPSAVKKSPERKIMVKTNIVSQASLATNAKLMENNEDYYSGYNSGDEHMQPKVRLLSSVEWRRRDEQFAKCMSERGYVLKPVEEDGACLFRSIALQIYGDEDMHDVIRQHTMDYIYKNREYFRNFVTEDINSYITRKRRKDSHGNHIEIQAMSEIYNRPVEVYCYQPKPINIFNSSQFKNGYVPLRLSYQRCSHYNAIIDPYNATVGVGLGLAGYKPELQTREALRLSEQMEIEQTLFEDKLKSTDWEATNDAIEEQIARESYLEWCRENVEKSRRARAATVTSSPTATITSESATAQTPLYAMEKSSDNEHSNANADAATVKRRAVDVGAAAASSIAQTGKEMNALVSYGNTMYDDGQEINDFKGFESDDTDGSSSSLLNESVAGKYYLKTRERSKKQKTRSLTNLMKFHKKLRRDFKDNSGEATTTLVLTIDDRVTSTEMKQINGGEMKRPAAVDMEPQQPSTSKQSNGPDTQRNNTAAVNANGNNGTNALSNGSQVAADHLPISSFYQELLEASYGDEGLGQLSESEMLQRAIQLSTQDYIEDQKRKYLYGS